MRTAPFTTTAPAPSSRGPARRPGNGTPLPPAARSPGTARSRGELECRPLRPPGPDGPPEAPTGTTVRAAGARAPGPGLTGFRPATRDPRPATDPKLLGSPFRPPRGRATGKVTVLFAQAGANGPAAGHRPAAGVAPGRGLLQKARAARRRWTAPGTDAGTLGDARGFRPPSFPAYQLSSRSYREARTAPRATSGDGACGRAPAPTPVARPRPGTPARRPWPWPWWWPRRRPGGPGGATAGPARRPVPPRRCARRP